MIIIQGLIGLCAAGWLMTINSVQGVWLVGQFIYGLHIFVWMLSGGFVAKFRSHKRPVGDPPGKWEESDLHLLGVLSICEHLSKRLLTSSAGFYTHSFTQ